MKKWFALCAAALCLTLCAGAFAAAPFTPSLNVESGSGANTLNYQFRITANEDNIRLSDYVFFINMPYSTADATLLNIWVDNAGATLSHNPYYISLTGDAAADVQSDSTVNAYVTTLCFPSSSALLQTGDYIEAGIRVARSNWSNFTNVPTNDAQVVIKHDNTQVYPATTFVFTSSAPDEATRGAAYSHRFTAFGASSYRIHSGDAAPRGLSLSEAGVLSGTPEESGTFRFTVIVQNGSGDTAEQAVTLTVLPGATEPPAPPETGDAVHPLALLCGLLAAAALCALLLGKRAPHRR